MLPKPLAFIYGLLRAAVGGAPSAPPSNKLEVGKPASPPAPPPSTPPAPAADDLPARLTLVRADDSVRRTELPRPTDEKKARGLPWIPTAEICCREYLELGFQDLGTYSCREIPDRHYVLLWHPEKRMSGIIVTHKASGVVAVVSMRFPSGIELSATNQNLSEFLTQDAESRRAYLLSAPIRELVQRVAEDASEIAESPCVDFAADPKRAFEAAYARQLDKRIARAVDEGEIRRHAAAAGLNVTEKDFQHAFEAARVRYARLATIACLDNFLKSGALSEAEIARYRVNLLVIHGRMKDDELRAGFIQCAARRGQEAEQIVRGGHGNGLELFASWCAEASDPLYRLVGKVDTPVEAHIYLCMALNPMG